MASLLAQVDAHLDALFAGWNIWSTTILAVLIAVLLSPLFFSSEPDIHPFLLGRQAAASPVRESGESAVYRSLDIPHGYPLRSGLNVKDESASKWSLGRDGDLRDIWLKASKVGVGASGGKILGLKGNNEPVESTFEDLSRQINAVGQYISKAGGQRVAIYLPNSTEFLVSVFASAFYNFTPILIPLDTPLEALGDIIRRTKADAVIASGGVVSEDDLAKVVPDSKLVIWVVQSTSQHMDFASNSKAGANVIEWHSLVSQSQATAALPQNESKDMPSIISVWQGTNGMQITEYTQGNLISAIAAQSAVLPRNHTFQPTDLIVPLESLTQTFPLSILLAALYAQASIALTSVAGLSPDFALAFQGSIKPTIIIASTATLLAYHAQQLKTSAGLFNKVNKYRQTASLAAGTMRILTPHGPRVIYTSDKAGSSEPLSGRDLNDLRISTGARLVYALTVPGVAGAVCQTSMLDYRIDDDSAANKRAHFGAPLSSVEIKVVGNRIADDEYRPEGQLVVAGPAVVGGEAKTEIRARFGVDQTLRLI